MRTSSYQFPLLEVLFCVLLFPLSAQAFENLDPILNEIQSETEAMTGQNGLQALIEFKRSVEASAFEVTMRLCSGYRYMTGMGDMKLPEGHDPNLGESLSAWSRIAGEGLNHTFSSIGGIKATYATEKALKIWNFETWFGSVYPILLVRSWGFLQGAAHCLGTVNRRQIHLFAAHIAIVDYESTLASEIIVGKLTAASLKMVGELIAKIPWWSLSPVRELTRTLRSRIDKGKVALASTTLAPMVSPVIVDNTTEFLRVADLNKNLFKSMTNPGSELRQRSEADSRFILMSVGLEKFADEWPHDRHVPRFRDWAKANITRTDLDLTRTDVKALAEKERQGNLKGEDLNEFKVLMQIMAILNQVDLQN